MEEHDYMGLKEEEGEEEEGSSCGGSLKGTELRLGLPGSESPERVDTAVLTLAPPNGFYGLGSKRVFSDAISGSGGVMKWVFSSGGANGSAEAEYGKGGGGMGENSDAVIADGSEKVAGVEKKKSHHSSPTAGINDRGMVAPAAKAQVVGWPPIRSYRKNSMVASFPSKNNTSSSDVAAAADDEPGKKHCLYVKVSMDGAPYLRKVDLKSYHNYKDLSSALEKMFSCFTIGQCGSHGSTDIFHSSENVLTYEDKDEDWMLVGDVPWVMFTETCKRLRIMKGSDAIGLAPRAMGKSKARN